MRNRRNREVLKSYFRLGSSPTESHFADLIDSVPNLAEEGLLRTQREGLLFYPGAEDGRVASAYRNADELQDPRKMPCWSLVLGDEKELLLMNEKGETLLSLSQDKKAYIHKAREEEKPAERQEGSYQELPADGCWHDLPIEWELAANVAGCGMYQVIAGYRTTAKKYRMINAMASYCKGRRRKIFSPQKRWGCWWSPIRIRWKRRGDTVFLQMRAKKKKKGEGVVHYRLTNLYTQRVDTRKED